MLRIKLPTLRQIGMALNASNLALGLKTSTLIAAVSILYFQDLSIVFTDALNSEETSYLLIIPFLFAYLIYRKRKMLGAFIGDTHGQGSATRLGTMAGLLLCTTAVLFYWYGSSTFTPLEYHMLTLPVFVSGLILIFFNPQTLRQAAFPVIFLFLLVPPPSEIFYGFGSTLSGVSSGVSNAIVNFVGVHSTITTDFGTPAINIIGANGVPLSPFSVDVACSGLYSLVGFFIFAAFIAFIVRDKTWKKLAAFFLGLPLVYALNIVRITTILLIGYQWGEELALNVFHLLGGWVLIFLGTFFLLVVSEKALKTQLFARKEAKVACPSCNPGVPETQEPYCSDCGRLVKPPKIELSRIDVTKIVAVALAIILLVTIQTPLFALTKGPAQILIQTPQGEQGNTQILPKFSGYDLQFVYRDIDFEKISGQNLSLMYVYNPQDQTREPIWVGVEIADTVIGLHGWQVCLISWPLTHGLQPAATQLDVRDIEIVQNPPMTARFFAWNYTSTNETDLVLYWYETAVFTINNISQQKQVELSLIITYPKNITADEAKLQPMAIAIAQYWEPIRTWDSLAMFLSHNALALDGAMVVLLAAIPIFSIFKNQKQKKLNLMAFPKLSKPNQQLIETIRKIEKSSIANLNKILEVYQQTTNQKVRNEKLQQELLGLEKTGLIKRYVINNQDSPVQGWRT